MLDLSETAMRCVPLASACKTLAGTVHGKAHVYAHLQNLLLSLLEKMPGLTPQSHLGLHLHPQHPAPPALLRQGQCCLRQLDHRSRVFSTGRHALVHFAGKREGERGVLPVAAKTTGTHIVRSAHGTCPGYS